jgi:hypothetical protein
MDVFARRGTGAEALCEYVVEAEGYKLNRTQGPWQKIKEYVMRGFVEVCCGLDDKKFTTNMKPDSNIQRAEAV